MALLPFFPICNPCASYILTFIYGSNNTFYVNPYKQKGKTYSLLTTYKNASAFSQFTLQQHFKPLFSKDRTESHTNYTLNFL